MLHIITLAYRFEFLPRIYASIPKHDDICWHLSIAKNRGIPKYAFIKKDARIHIHLIECNDDDFVSKRNAVFEKINDGYFYLLDDDGIFINDAYEAYREYSRIGYQGMIVGDRIIRQKNFKSTIEKAAFPTEDPATTIIDTGMVIASSNVLRSVKWQWVPKNEDYPRDYLFWSNCFKYFGKENVVLCNKVFFYYNYSMPLLHFKKKIFNRKIELKIYNYYLAYYLEILALKIKQIIR